MISSNFMYAFRDTSTYSLPAVLFALPIPSWLRIVDMKPNSKSSSQVVELTPQIIQRLNVKKSKKF